MSSLTFSPPSGSHLPMGTTTVNFTAIDNAGNSSQGSFTVTVNQTGFVGSVLYVIGTSGNDAFVINGTNPSSVSITIGGKAVYGSPFNLSGGQTINVYGNAGNDTFTISGAVGATLDGGTGSNTFTVTNYTGTGTLTGGGSDTRDRDQERGRDQPVQHRVLHTRRWHEPDHLGDGHGQHHRRRSEQHLQRVRLDRRGQFRRRAAARIR